MTLKFGTDGVRGSANDDLTPELILALGRAAAQVIDSDEFVIGRDTRRSGPLLRSALAAGLAAEGVTVDDLGVVPTPAVAYLSATQHVAGAMISASHNPFADNGVKFFTPGGRKLTDPTEAALEATLAKLWRSERPPDDAPVGADVGIVLDASDGVAEYERHLATDVIAGRRLDGVRVVVDCANGAASTVAQTVLHRLGAAALMVGVEPDGVNINEGCGSNHPAGLQRLVVENGADLGFAFDGDADRVVAVDAEGELVDGDHLIAICAADLHERGLLRADTVVVTVMSNLGFRLAMEERGITVVETDVGDRSVLAALDAGGFSLGGEQSGHIVFPEVGTTGDGLLSAITVLDVMVRRGRPLSELASVMTRLPQVLVSVHVAERDPDIARTLESEIAAVEAELGDHGRVLVRPSGTEPVVRVMVEAPTSTQAAEAADRLVAAVNDLAG